MHQIRSCIFVIRSTLASMWLRLSCQDGAWWSAGTRVMLWFHSPGKFCQMQPSDSLMQLLRVCTTLASWTWQSLGGCQCQRLITLPTGHWRFCNSTLIEVLWLLFCFFVFFLNMCCYIDFCFWIILNWHDFDLSRHGSDLLSSVGGRWCALWSSWGSQVGFHSKVKLEENWKTHCLKTNPQKPN